MRFDLVGFIATLSAISYTESKELTEKPDVLLLVEYNIDLH
jgi:hypothetical protein